MLGWAPTKVENIIVCSISSQAMGEGNHPHNRAVDQERHKDRQEKERQIATVVCQHGGNLGWPSKAKA